MNLGLRLHPTKYWILPLFLITAMLGCRSTYYAMWESVGKEKRHLLKDEVAAAREDQAQASSTTSTPRPWGRWGRRWPRFNRMSTCSSAISSVRSRRPTPFCRHLRADGDLILTAGYRDEYLNPRISRLSQLGGDPSGTKRLR